MIYIFISVIILILQQMSPKTCFCSDVQVCIIRILQQIYHFSSLSTAKSKISAMYEKRETVSWFITSKHFWGKITSM